jgi:uncharacterized protein (TIGR02453 family)
MLALIEDLNADLAKFAPDFVMEPKKAIFRIYRDVRFSANKLPYKTNIAASFRKRGLEGSGLYFSVSGDEVEVAAGIYHPDREVTLAVRQHIAENYDSLERLLNDKKTAKLCGELKGDELSRAPKGFDPVHPAIKFIKKKDWLYDIALEPSIATTPELSRKLSALFRAMYPLAEYLNKPLLGRNLRRNLNIICDGESSRHTLRGNPRTIFIATVRHRSGQNNVAVLHDDVNGGNSTQAIHIQAWLRINRAIYCPADPIVLG